MLRREALQVLSLTPLLPTLTVKSELDRAVEIVAQRLAIPEEAMLYHYKSPEYHERREQILRESVRLYFTQGGSFVGSWYQDIKGERTMFAWGPSAFEVVETATTLKYVHPNPELQFVKFLKRQVRRPGPFRGWDQEIDEAVEVHRCNGIGGDKFLGEYVGGMPPEDWAYQFEVPGRDHTYYFLHFDEQGELLAHYNQWTGSTYGLEVGTPKTGQTHRVSAWLYEDRDPVEKIKVWNGLFPQWTKELPRAAGVL